MCIRDSPDTVPGSPDWDVRADALARAMRLIGDGVVEREGVPGVAARLGYSTRQLQRITLGELGASPLAIARSQRAHTARILIETSPMPLSDVAYAAGFGSIRSFNEAIKVAFDRTPTQLRDLNPNLRTLRGGAAGESASSGGLRGTKTVLGRVDVRLAFRPPLASGPLFGHLAATAVPGVEEWRDGAYRRTLRLPYGPGIVALAQVGVGESVQLAGQPGQVFDDGIDGAEALGDASDHGVRQLPVGRQQRLRMQDSGRGSAGQCEGVEVVLDLLDGVVEARELDLGAARVVAVHGRHRRCLLYTSRCV